MENLIKKIESKEATIGIIGLGYVGIPLAMQFCKAGFKVLGFDIDVEKIKKLRKKESYLSHITDEEIRDNLTKFECSVNIQNCDCYIICVPTPMTEHHEPNLDYINSAFKQIFIFLEDLYKENHNKYKDIYKDKFICLESTTYPGTTRDVIDKLLSQTLLDLEIGKDLFISYSPEREDPNNAEFKNKPIPKLISGYTDNCLKIAESLYSSIVPIVSVSKPEVAEAAKIVENIYRSVNIALVNELKMLFDKMDIDVWEVINAAKTKPFGYKAFYPGPGLGGHCIPIDPFYLSWKAKEYDFSARFITLAGEINTHMPYYIVKKTFEALNRSYTSLRGSKVLVLGLAYKKDINDDRESPSHKIIELLEQHGCKVNVNDPYINHPKHVALTKENLKGFDAVIISTDHTIYNYKFIVDNSKLVIDTRNATNGLEGNIFKA